MTDGMTDEQKELCRIGLWLKALSGQGDRSCKMALDKIDIIQATVVGWAVEPDLDPED